MKDKADALAALVQRRRSEVPDGYFCVSQFHDGKYDCDFVSPWTRSAQNLDAELMIVAQDWASEKFMRRSFDPELARLGYSEHVGTNQELFRRLKAHTGLEFSDTYATNVFPFIKPEHMSEPIPRQLLIDAAAKFAFPQIEIIAPLLVICLGIRTFDAVRAALSPAARDQARQMRWAEYDNLSCVLKCGQTEIHAVTHLGAKGKIGRRSKIEPEWNLVAKRLEELRNGKSTAGFVDSGSRADRVTFGFATEAVSGRMHSDARNES